jgi:hypothetical protein
VIHRRGPGGGRGGSERGVDGCGGGRGAGGHVGGGEMKNNSSASV